MCIRDRIDEACAKQPGRWAAFTSLGVLRYLSAMKYAAAVVGNSSSGVVEKMCIRDRTMTEKKFIPLSVPNFCGNEKAYVNDAVVSEWVSTGGSLVPTFEQAVASYVGMPLSLIHI